MFRVLHQAAELRFPSKLEAVLARQFLKPDEKSDLEILVFPALKIFNDLSPLIPGIINKTLDVWRTKCDNLSIPCRGFVCFGRPGGSVWGSLTKESADRQP